MEAPSFKIATEFENKDCIVYKAQCACFHPNDDQTIEVTYIPDIDSVNISISTKVFFDVNNHSLTQKTPISFFQGMKDRMKAAWSIMTTGRATYETEFVFENSRHLNDYTLALLYALKKMKNRVKKDEEVVYD
jgi:hypothetical protein